MSEETRASAEPSPDGESDTRDWRRFVPTAGTLALLVCLLAPTILVGGGSTSTHGIDPHDVLRPVSSVQRFGPGYVTISTTYENGVPTTEVDIGWLTIAIVLLVGFVLARSVARRVELRRSVRAARRILIGAPLGVVLLSVLVGGLVSRLYWGYWWSRPGTRAFTSGVEEVTHLSFVRAVVGPDGTLQAFVEDEDASLDEEITQLVDDPYYALPARLLAPLADAGVISDDVEPLGDARLAELPEELKRVADFATPSAGYEDFLASLHGVAMYVTSDQAGGEMILGLSGGEVSNDHRPHDEFRWNYTSDGAPARVLHQRFFYDLAGLEGAEWWSISLLLGVAGAIGCTALAVGAGLRRPRL